MYLPFKLFKLNFCTLILINSILCYNPSERFLHNSIIIDDKLLVFSGYTNKSYYYAYYTSEFFYLDLSKSFDNNNITWKIIPDNGLPVSVYHSTVVSSLDDSTIYLIGGFMRNKDTLNYDYSNLVYTYDYPTSTWSVPILGGDSFPPLHNIKGIIDKSGKIYIHGEY
ncbi:hypothetical protein Glove_136g77 [Diversispora epigaea]|uniref:Galactose oxidase n=1 Tax=Diversispora epigaea TaxID=1348612 RepID=A0A397J338_9GLOM|nr:hypothetical protein Glove_136g77 [Diversispora epigaea]